MKKENDECFPAYMNMSFVASVALLVKVFTCCSFMDGHVLGFIAHLLSAFNPTYVRPNTQARLDHIIYRALGFRMKHQVQT